MLISWRSIEENIDLWRKSCALRNLPDHLDELRTLHAQRKKLSFELEQLRSQRNSIDYRDSHFRDLSEKIKDLTKLFDEIDREVVTLMNKLPNFVHPDTPAGASDKDNVVIEESEPLDLNLNFVDSEKFLCHEELTDRLYPKNAAAEICGSRTSIFRGEVALLKFALAQWLVLFHREAGFEYVDVPSLVSSGAMYNAGKLPKFSDDAFVLNENSWLASTGEIPLVCLAKYIPELPQKLMTLSECFRKEAGAAGKDTRGWVRQHQFSKVELVIVASSCDAEESFEFLCNRVKEVLNTLKLKWRKVAICGGDLGFGAYKQVDFEVWLSGQKRWLEVSSVSDCRTYQSARLNIKDKNKNLAWTLNATGGVPGRLLAAIIEQYSSNGILRIPECLQKIMNKTEIHI